MVEGSWALVCNEHRMRLEVEERAVLGKLKL